MLGCSPHTSTFRSTRCRLLPVHRCSLRERGRSIRSLGNNHLTGLARQRRRVVIFNDANSVARQNSDIAHELSQGPLVHEPRHAIVRGCRDYSKTKENQARRLAGCLLVPRDAFFTVAILGLSIEVAAVQYGVSNCTRRSVILTEV